MSNKYKKIRTWLHQHVQVHLLQPKAPLLASPLQPENQQIDFP